MTKKLSKNLTKIFVAHGLIIKMSEELGVSRDAIGDALNAKKTTKLGNLVRKVAVKFYGGVEQA